ncbi:MAG: 50S ribosomal protein L33 [Bacilli bacterium]|jgi:large subunit ribosomal protein L33
MVFMTMSLLTSLKNVSCERVRIHLLTDLVCNAIFCRQGKDRIIKMMRQKIILICSICLNRNYTATKRKDATTGRIEMKKFCPHCNAHTLHKESK